MSEDPGLTEMKRNWELKKSGKLSQDEMERRNNKIKFAPEDKEDKPLFRGQKKQFIGE